MKNLIVEEAISSKILDSNTGPIPEVPSMLFSYRALLSLFLISFTAFFGISNVNAQISGQVIIDEQFDGNEVDTSIFQFANAFEPGTFGRTLLRSPNLPGQAGLPFDGPPVQGGTLRLRVETYSPFETPVNGPSSGVFFLADEIRTIQTFAPTSTAGFSFETRARFVDDATNPLSPGIVGGAFLFGLDPDFSPTNFVRDEVDFELLSNLPQNIITTNIFNDDPFDVAGRFNVQTIPGLDLTEFNNYRIESTLETTRFFVNNELIREETVDLAVDPQEFRLNINTPSAPFASAFNAELQPTDNPLENEVFIFEIDSLVITQFDPADSPPPVVVDTSGAAPLFDLTGFQVPDFEFGPFQNGQPTEEGFAVSIDASDNNFGFVGVNNNLITRNFPLTVETEFLVEATIGASNDTDLVLGVREASGEFFSILVPAVDLTDDGQAIVGVDDFFFNGDVTDGIPNTEIVEVSLQSPFAAGNAIDVLLQRVSVLPAPPLLGDVNLDGVVDFFDISPFISILSSGGFQTEADIDQSDKVDFLDISPFITILSNQ